MRRWLSRRSSSTGSISSDSRELVKEELLSMIPRRRFGAPATNLTVPSRTVRRIEKRVQALECYDEELRKGGPIASNRLAQELLDGPWRLLYSDASEITNLVDLPFGFQLGAVFQPIDVATGRVENQANVKHKLLLASAHTRVLAEFTLEKSLSARNRAGIVNNEGRRINVRFDRVIFSLRRFLFIPFLGRFVRKVARPRGSAERAIEAAAKATAAAASSPSGATGAVVTAKSSDKVVMEENEEKRTVHTGDSAGEDDTPPLPCIDVTYLDDDVRISRGGDGSLFVLQRAQKGWYRPKPMLEDGLRTLLCQRDATDTYDASTNLLPSRSSS